MSVSGDCDTGEIEGIDEKSENDLSEDQEH